MKIGHEGGASEVIAAKHGVECNSDQSALLGDDQFGSGFLGVATDMVPRVSRRIHLLVRHRPSEATFQLAPAAHHHRIGTHQW